MYNKYFGRTVSLVLVAVAIYFLGPAPTPPKWDITMPTIPSDRNELDAYIQNQEQKHKLKPDNEARIVWFGGQKKKTAYSVVYLHGFSASQKEGDPVHREFAKKFGCNLYLSRLADHGIDTTERLLYFTADRLWDTAKKALAIGKAIGDKVILLSTSTGGTMALVLAATYPDDVYALINMSPNIKINDPFAFILNDHWGLQIARLVKGGKYIKKEQSPEEQKYWYGKYRLEAAVQLQELLESKMKEETFRKVHQPSLTLYYYKNKKEQDPVVRVDAILAMNASLGTPDTLKVAQSIPLAGTHAIGSDIESKDVKGVVQAVNKFAQEKLCMTPYRLDTLAP